MPYYCLLALHWQSSQMLAGRKIHPTVSTVFTNLRATNSMPSPIAAMVKHTANITVLGNFFNPLIP